MGKLSLAFCIGFVVIAGLAILGLIKIFKKLYKISPMGEIILRPQIAIIVENNQNQVEGIVRCFYTNAKNTKDLWIVDRGSTDQTPNILEKLSTHFSGLNILLLSDMPIEASIQEVMRYIKAPAVMFLDANKLSFREIVNLINGVHSQKSVEIGLKTYTK